MDQAMRERLMEDVQDLRRRIPPTMAVDMEIRDPMVLAALRSRGLDPDALPVTASDPVQGLQHESDGEEDLPGIAVWRDVLDVTWRREEGDVVLEIARHQDGIGWIRAVILEKAHIPQTVLAGAVGETLDRLVGTEGAEAYRIVDYISAEGAVRVWVEGI